MKRMRVGWRMVAVLCVALPVFGVPLQQPDASGPAAASGRAPGDPASQGTPAEKKNEPEASPQPAVPQQSAPAPAESNAGSKVESQKRPPAAEPVTSPAASEPKNEPQKMVGSGITAKRHADKKRTAPANEGLRKVVIQQGSVDEPTAQIVTGMAPDEANRERSRTEQMLQSAEDVLKRLGFGPFGALREESVSQIRNYVGGARVALKEGDIPRAHMLAEKAELLAKDLTRR